jgi:K+-sensing histidine kinase KdpD
LLRQITKSPPGQAPDRARTEGGLRHLEWQAARLAGMLSNVREVLRLVDQTVTLNITRADLGIILEGLADQLVGRGRLESTLVVFTPYPIMAAVDSLRLRQALLALIDHALALDDLASRITLATGEDEDRPVITVCLRSSLTEEDWKTLLTTLDYREAVPAFDGVGLGVFIAHRLIGMHQGRLEVASDPNGDLRFTITLPDSAEAPHA